MGWHSHLTTSPPSLAVTPGDGGNILTLPHVMCLDHRIGLTVNNMDAVLQGLNLGNIIQPLLAQSALETMAALSEEDGSTPV